MKQIMTDTLIKLAQKDKNVMLLTGDLGFPHFLKFANKFPKRYFNMGVAEQNMIGVAAGLALSGKIVYIYSIIPFAIMRPLEHIRNDICYHNLNVKIMAYGAGVSYATHGATHFGIADLAITQALPNMKIYSPANSFEAGWCLNSAYTEPGPAYIRFGKGENEDIYHKQKPKFHFPKGVIVKKGRDVLILVSGTLLSNALKAAQLLAKKQISVQVVSIPVIKPIDRQLIINLAKKFSLILTLEEHSLIGGLGSTIADILAENSLKKNIVFQKLALPDKYPQKVGSQEYMRQVAGLSVSRIVRTIKNKINK